MRIIEAILRELDRRKFLGFPIWEFSYHSFFRQYGHFFLREIALRHPLRTLAGLWAYRQVMRNDGLVTRLCAGDEEAFLQWTCSESRGNACQGDGLLVALSFCQKPLPGSGVSRGGCPAGRFNHECAVLGRPDPFVPEERLPLSCRTCDVRAFGLAALRAGAAVYIMTSALDIGWDILVPLIDRHRFRQGIFFLCPYSMPAFILPLCIGRMEALFVPYDAGDCRNYSQFIRADVGQKSERTQLSSVAREKVMALLDRIATGRDCPPSRHFRREGALFVPTTASNG
ncbi:MAG: hypothetical protein NUW24_14075 [Anaerolineae bacterium]|jgi:hypothetical protein|nr:hypothetical protein [Anaerolineae bacterium]